VNNNTQQGNQKASPKQLFWIRLGVLFIVIAISVYILLLPEDQLKKLSTWGYLGIFLISILANATVLIPAPGLVIIFTMGARFNPIVVGIVAGLGATLGELSGYMAGFSGQALIENRNAYDRMVKWIKINGPLTIAVLAFIPNPLFDLAGIVAGMLKMPLRKFLFWAAIGKIVKMVLTALAGAGAFSIPWINELLPSN
jgi:membrane protein DedA with SNARE-associated domain